MIVNTREFVPTIIRMKTRICRRCNKSYEDGGKSSKICPDCRKPGGNRKK